MKTRMYMVSLMATKREKVLGGDGLDRIFFDHRPMMSLAPDIQIARNQAEELAFKIYPLGDGWYNRNATISALGADFFKDVERHAQASQGLAGDIRPAEQLEEFHFGDTDIQSDL